MSKKDFEILKKKLNLLITDRYPCEYFDRVRISLENDNVVAISKEKTEIIPIESTFLLFLGGGCSISSKAMEKCMKAGANVVMGNAQVKVHTAWGGNRWNEPKTNINQVKKVLNEELRLKVAKFFTCLRFIRDGHVNLLDKILKSKDSNEVLGYEASAYKKTYKELAIEHNQTFKRKFEIKNSDIINERLNILNNCLYAYITSIIISYGLNPSIGFCHGIGRRGGLSFDLADIFKLNYSILPSFVQDEKDSKTIIYELSAKIQERKHLFTRQVLELCKVIGSNDFDIKEIDLDIIFKDINYEFDYRGFFKGNFS